MGCELLQPFRKTEASKFKGAKRKTVSPVPLFNTAHGCGCINTPHGGTKPPY